jgi:uncharacterized membrane protein
MTVPLQNLHVGSPIRHESLSVFPLFSDVSGGIDYRLSDDALADESLLVEEVSQGGSVPELLVENKGDVRVLFLEGEELVGAKQNRILNTSVLIAARTKVTIPVSCVEQGRWGYNSQYFGSSGSHSPSKLRRALRASVSRSVKEKRGHRSDQGQVWKEVASLLAAHAVESGTAAMSDVFDTYRDRIAAYREKVKYVEGASGVAVAIGDRVAFADHFDKPSTCQKAWDRMLSGVFFDALEAGDASNVLLESDVEQFLASTSDLRWEQSEAVGEGEEYRAESKRGDHASALIFQDTVVHGSVVAV